MTSLGLRLALDVHALGATSSSADLPIVSGAIYEAVLAASQELGFTSAAAQPSIFPPRSSPAEGVAAYQLARLLRDIEAKLCDPAAGLRIGRLLRPEHLGVAGTTLLSALTAHDALESFVRWRLSLLGGPAWHLRRRGDRVYLGVDRGEPAVAQLCAAAAAEVALALLGRSSTEKVMLCFQGGAPSCAARLSASTQLPMQFDAPLHGISLPAEAFVARRSVADPQLAQAVGDLATKLSNQQSASGSWCERIWQAILASPQVATTELERLAPLWQTSSRSLRRWLEAEGTPFKALREEATMLRVQQLLRAQHSPRQVAREVGFADESSLRRAYKRWQSRIDCIASRPTLDGLKAEGR